MNKKIFDTVKRMIEKEVYRNSLTELCEYWDITVDDFDEFMELASAGFDAQFGDSCKK